jgi:hypothetical protein
MLYIFYENYLTVASDLSEPVETDLSVDMHNLLFLIYVFQFVIFNLRISTDKSVSTGSDKSVSYLKRRINPNINRLCNRIRSPINPHRKNIQIAVDNFGRITRIFCPHFQIGRTHIYP